MMKLGAYILWECDVDNIRRFARWLGIPGSSFLPRASLIHAVSGELARKR